MVENRGHPIPHDIVKPKRDDWLDRTVVPIAKALADDNIRIDDEEVANRLRNMSTIVFPAAVPDGRTTQRKPRSDRGVQRRERRQPDALNVVHLEERRVNPAQGDSDLQHLRI